MLGCDRLQHAHDVGRGKTIAVIVEQGVVSGMYSGTCSFLTREGVQRDRLVVNSFSSHRLHEMRQRSHALCGREGRREAEGCSLTR